MNPRSTNYEVDVLTTTPSRQFQLFPVHCHWPRQSCLSHAKASSSLWHGFSSSHFQSFLDSAFLSFNLEDIFYYSYPQDGKASQLSCFLPAYLSHLLRLKAFLMHHSISSTLVSRVSFHSFSLQGQFVPWMVYPRSNSLSF